MITPEQLAWKLPVKCEAHNCGKPALYAMVDRSYRRYEQSKAVCLECYSGFYNTRFEWRRQNIALWR